MPRSGVGHVRRMPTTTTTKSQSTGKSQRAGSSSGSTPKRGRDAVAFLRDEHRAVEKEFKRFEELGPNAVKTRDKVVDGIIERLSKHAAIEEMVFYPLVRERLSDLEPDVLEALEEHHLVKVTMAELTKTAPDDERFVAKTQVLIENVRHHVDEEESELFPKVREAFSRTELEEIGALLAEAREHAPSRPHPAAPDTPPGNLAANVLSAPLDSASRLIGSARRVIG